jgi:phosphoadenosine phosphosulfate reductase
LKAAIFVDAAGFGQFNMYSYTHDSETGGLLLNSTPTGRISKEPRPVYAQELNILGFDAFWEYDEQNEVPYLWAEHNEYYYRGKLVAKLKGGDLRVKPEIEILAELPHKRGVAAKLQPVDLPLMIEKNSELLEVIEKVTLKLIFDTYKRYNKKLDVFYVAFSGGKDSLVLLNLVKKALSKEQFIVVFGDTGMEFPDTEETVKKIEKQCRKDGIVFLRAKSVYPPQESWELFGHPSRRIRWCCSVHKSVPQNLILRKFLKKNDYTGLAFVGVRNFESFARSKYDYESYSAKLTGQRTLNPILPWTSAEIWLYIYAENVLLNESYKKGIARVGCLFCPMGGNKADFLQYVSYTSQVTKYIDIIKKSYQREPKTFDDYINKGYWRARRNGVELIQSPFFNIHYKEKIDQTDFIIEVIESATDWQEWIKPLGKLVARSKKKRKNSTEKEYLLLFEDKQYEFSVLLKEQDNLYPNHVLDSGYSVRIAEKMLKDNPSFAKLFKYVFRKAAYCVGCQLCSSNCRFGCISFENGLTVNCKHCGDKSCFNVEDGCLVANSLRTPQGDKKMTEKIVGINCFLNLVPKTEWINEFFQKKNDFWNNNNLNYPQIRTLKKLLVDSNLIDKKGNTTKTVGVIEKIGFTNATAWGIILSQFAYNPQIEWYIKNLDIDVNYPSDNVLNLLLLETTQNNAGSVLRAFSHFMENQLGTVLNFGSVSKKDKITYLRRNRCVVEDARVVLYSLYIYAKKSGNYQFRLSDLFEKREDALSPIQIFGLNRDTMEKMLLGLTNSYPKFINATFTHDLEKITLSEEKTSDNVLTLF